MASYQDKAPGVYIEEITPAGPIAGVGTSIAAFIGRAMAGPTNLPTKITSWTDYERTFGGYSSRNDIYLPHAVWGFFLNGGTSAYIVRAGTAKQATFEMQDGGSQGGFALVVTARQEGREGNKIRIGTTNAVGLLEQLAKPTPADIVAANADGTEITLQDEAAASAFASGDIIKVEGATDTSEISHLSGIKLVLVQSLKGVAAGKKIALADLAKGGRRLRFQGKPSLETGSVISIGKGEKRSVCVVEQVSGKIVRLEEPGLTNVHAMGEDVTVESLEFKLTVSLDSRNDSYLNLSMDPRHSRYFAAVVNADPKGLVTLRQPAIPSLEWPDRRPKNANQLLLTNGKDDDQISPEILRNAIAALQAVDDVNLVCAPGLHEQPFPELLREHCELMRDRFAILDAPPRSSLGPPDSDWRIGLSEARSRHDSEKGYAALYYPWIKILHPIAKGANGSPIEVIVPPSGHIAGIYARTDNERGVHKAPANEAVRGAVAIEHRVTAAEQGELNEKGINCLRIFPGRPLEVWGARTTIPKGDTAWRYINVRRLFLYVERSIQEGIRWAVFEPNDTLLWKKLERTITEFLTRVWQSGALFGRTAKEAFYVKIDEELNPSADRALGQVNIEVGIAPVRPAEFVVVRIGMWEGGARITEL